MAYIDLQNDLPGIRGPMAFRPETAKPLNELAEILLHSENNSLTRGEREMIGAYASSLNDCFFCHNLAVYSGASTTDALTTEMLKQRRYSLFYEGHRWIDMRRYNLLSQLPVDRTGDDVWDKFPLPVTEQ
ncbi:MAG: RagB/SusD family nutrient uptake outer membrane protein [Bacteroidota bacterium]